MANTHARSKELPKELYGEEGITPEEATEHAQDIILAMHADGHHYDEDTLEHVQKQLHDLESAGADMEGIHSHLKDITDKGIEVNSDEHHEEISRQHQERVDASEKERIDREDRQNQRKEHLEDIHNHPGWNNANVHHEVTKETVGPGGFPSIREQRSKAYANSYDENGKRTQIEHNSQEHQEHGVPLGAERADGRGRAHEGCAGGVPCLLPYGQGDWTLDARKGCPCSSSCGSLAQGLSRAPTRPSTTNFTFFGTGAPRPPLNNGGEQKAAGLPKRNIESGERQLFPFNIVSGCGGRFRPG